MNDFMKKHIYDILKKDMTEQYLYSPNPDYRQKSKSIAFDHMVKILKNGHAMSYQIRDLEDVVDIWQTVDDELTRLKLE